MDTLVAPSPPRCFDRALRELSKQARAPTTHDSTRYGISRASPRSFYAHHIAAISAAIALADASSVLNGAAAMSFRLAIGLAPYSKPPRAVPVMLCVFV